MSVWLLAWQSGRGRESEALLVCVWMVGGSDGALCFLSFWFAFWFVVCGFCFSVFLVGFFLFFFVFCFFGRFFGAKSKFQKQHKK
jgi:hypothetical protein